LGVKKRYHLSKKDVTVTVKEFALFLKMLFDREVEVRFVNYHTPLLVYMNGDRFYHDKIEELIEVLNLRCADVGTSLEQDQLVLSLPSRVITKEKGYDSIRYWTLAKHPEVVRASVVPSLIGHRRFLVMRGGNPIRIFNSRLEAAEYSRRLAGHTTITERANFSLGPIPQGQEI
jgi:hypothetical protein